MIKKIVLLKKNGETSTSVYSDSNNLTVYCIPSSYYHNMAHGKTSYIHSFLLTIVNNSVPACIFILCSLVLYTTFWIFDKYLLRT